MPYSNLFLIHRDYSFFAFLAIICKKDIYKFYLWVSKYFDKLEKKFNMIRVKGNDVDDKAELRDFLFFALPKLNTMSNQCGTWFHTDEYHFYFLLY